jgi:CxxC motif-containing protein
MTYIDLSCILCTFSPDTKPTTGFKAPQGQGCPRCGFAVYAAEQMISKNRVSVGLQSNILHFFPYIIKYKIKIPSM